MKVQQILSSVCLIALVLPMAVNAEIYKWKDKNGVMIYSDTPPPATNVRVESIGKSGKDTQMKSTPAPMRNDMEAANEVKETEKNVEEAKSKAPVVDPKLQAVRARAKQAEIEKQNKQVKDEREAVYASNCKAARANYQSYDQGGRIYKMNEKGERVYMDDASTAAGKRQAQAEIQKYCK